MCKSLSFLLFFVLLLSCTKTNNINAPATAYDYSGQWVGKTSQDSTIVFQVQEDSIRSFSMGFYLKGLGTVRGRTGDSLLVPIPINKDSIDAFIFVLNINGSTLISLQAKFLSNTSISGYINVTNASISASELLTFNASKQ